MHAAGAAVLGAGQSGTAAPGLHNRSEVDLKCGLGDTPEAPSSHRRGLSLKLILIKSQIHKIRDA
jgi:hypothetical protein